MSARTAVLRHLVRNLIPVSGLLAPVLPISQRPRLVFRGVLNKQAAFNDPGSPAAENDKHVLSGTVRKAHS